MPNDRMSRFEIFIGTWNTTGEVLETASAPASVLLRPMLIDGCPENTLSCTTWMRALARSPPDRWK